MGALIGSGFGVGIVLILTALDPPTSGTARIRRRPLRRWLDIHGGERVSVAGFIALSLLIAFTIALMMLAVSRTTVVAALFGFGAAFVPAIVLSSRAHKAIDERREAWPDAIDNLGSAIRAGLSLPEAIAQLAERGPEPLRPHFAQFSHDYDRTGRFGDALDRLKTQVADPVGDRVVEALRIARDVGGGDLGRLLRALSGYLRDDLRTRGELRARQEWAVNGARLSAAAPWVVLLMMSFQPHVIARFATGAGPYILVLTAVVGVIAYRLMMRIGRLPRERRILS